MSTALNVIKLIVGWSFLVGGVLILFMGPTVPVQPGILFLGSIAASQLPVA